MRIARSIVRRPNSKVGCALSARTRWEAAVPAPRSVGADCAMRHPFPSGGSQRPVRKDSHGYGTHPRLVGHQDGQDGSPKTQRIRFDQCQQIRSQGNRAIASSNGLLAVCRGQCNPLSRWGSSRRGAGLPDEGLAFFEEVGLHIADAFALNDAPLDQDEIIF